MKPYCWHNMRGSANIHPADECGICSENNKNTKSARRMKDKKNLRLEYEEYLLEKEGSKDNESSVHIIKSD